MRSKRPSKSSSKVRLASFLFLLGLVSRTDDSIEGDAKLSFIQDAVLESSSSALKVASNVVNSNQALLEQEIDVLKTRDEELEAANFKLSTQLSELYSPINSELKLAHAETQCEAREAELKEKSDLILRLEQNIASLTEDFEKRADQLEEDAQTNLQKAAAIQAQMAKHEAYLRVTQRAPVEAAERQERDRGAQRAAAQAQRDNETRRAEDELAGFRAAHQEPAGHAGGLEQRSAENPARSCASRSR